MAYKIKENAVCGMIGYGSWATALVHVLLQNRQHIWWHIRNEEVLESVEDRLSVFASNTNNIYDPSATEIEIIQLDETQNNRKHIFIWINTNFMKSVTKKNDGYVIRVQTLFMESSSEDCVYEIHMSKDFVITFFGLDP